MNSRSGERGAAMPRLDERYLRKIYEEERAALFDVAQAQLEAEAIVPATPPLFVRRHGTALWLAAAVLIGAVLGAGMVLLNFFIFTRLLHITT